MDSNIEQNVIALFREKGFQRHQQLTQQIARRVLNEHSQFMMNQILNHCRYGKLQITPKGLGQVVSEAYHILINRLKQVQGDQGLIIKQKKFLNLMQQQYNHLSSLDQPLYSQKQQLNKLEKDMQITTNYLKQLQNNEKTFTQQYEIIDKLFKKYIHSAKLKKMNRNIQPAVQLNPKFLVYMFYMSVLGMLIQCVAVQLRPGWIAIMIYLQALFLLLIGYFNRKAAMYLTFSGMISIALDVVAIVILEFFQYQNTLQTLNDDILTKILNIFRKAAIILSILLRIGVLITSYPFMEPPLKKINFVLCGRTLPLNTRMKPGSLAHKQSSYSSTS